MHRRDEFLSMVKARSSAIIIYFTSPTDCIHCKTISPIVTQYFEQLSSRYATDVRCLYADVKNADNLDVYNFLKSKRIVTGAIPVLLFYSQTSENDINHAYIPEDSHTGGSSSDTIAFFTRVEQNLMEHATTQRHENSSSLVDF